MLTVGSVEWLITEWQHSIAFPTTSHLGEKTSKGTVVRCEPGEGGSCSESQGLSVHLSIVHLSIYQLNDSREAQDAACQNCASLDQVGRNP